MQAHPPTHQLLPLDLPPPGTGAQVATPDPQKLHTLQDKEKEDRQAVASIMFLVCMPALVCKKNGNVLFLLSHILLCQPRGHAGSSSWPTGRRGTSPPGLGLEQRTHGSFPWRSPGPCNLNSQASVSLAGGGNGRGAFTTDTCTESRENIYFLFGAMHITCKALGSPLCSTIKSLGSPEPPCRRCRWR